MTDLSPYLSVKERVALGSLIFHGEISPERPEPGHYFVQLVPGGAKVPTLVWVDCPIEFFDDQPWNFLDRGIVVAGKNATPWRIRARVGDTDVQPLTVWPRCAVNPIAQREYLYLLADARHAVMYEPHRPEASPHLAVDLTTQPPIF